MLTKFFQLQPELGLQRRVFRFAEWLAGLIIRGMKSFQNIFRRRVAFTRAALLIVFLSVGTLGEDKAVVQACNRANVGLVIDTFHFYAGESSFADFDGLDPRKVFIFHINDAENLPRADLRDSHRLFPGLGILPLAEILANLKKIGYQTMASIEIFRPEYWDMDPMVVGRLSRESMVKVIGAAGLL